MAKERVDPRFAPKFQNQMAKERDSVHPALDVLISNQNRIEAQAMLPKNYRGPGLLKTPTGRVEVEVVEWLGRKDDSDPMLHVSLMLRLANRQQRIEGPVPISEVEIDLSTIARRKAEEKRLRRAERYRKNLSS